MSIALRAAIGLWVLFLTTWIFAGGWAARTEARPGRERERLYLLMNMAGWAMMFIPPGRPFAPPLWINPPAVEWTLVALIAAGFAFCWWARLHLGKLWSGSVTRKEGHRVVDTGPYRLVRHPIYTGIILAGAGLAGLGATALGIAGFFLSSAGFWIKARLEERFLSEELGADAYAAYKARTPMLIPFLPVRAK
jgi:protein-S-isoprenylcysteine O-methyltransferase Ste14